MGWGNYARFWKYLSPVFMRVLAIAGWAGGLTAFADLRMRGSGRRGGGVIVVGWRDEDGGLGGAAVAGAAGDLVGGRRVLQLGDEVLVDVHAHAEHEAGAVFDGIGVGGEVEMAGGGGWMGVPGVAVVTLDAKVAAEFAHDVDDLVAGEVLGEDLEVDGLGVGTVGAVLGRGGVGGGGLGRGGGGDGEEEGGGRGEEAGAEALGHPWVLWREVGRSQGVLESGG